MIFITFQHWVRLSVVIIRSVGVVCQIQTRHEWEWSRHLRSERCLVASFVKLASIWIMSSGIICIRAISPGESPSLAPSSAAQTDAQRQHRQRCFPWTHVWAECRMCVVICVYVFMVISKWKQVIMSTVKDVVKCL